MMGVGVLGLSGHRVGGKGWQRELCIATKHAASPLGTAVKEVTVKRGLGIWPSLLVGTITVGSY